MADADSPATFATLWRLLIGQPQLLGAHVAAYGALLRDEGGRSLQLLLQHARLQALLHGSVTACVVLAGVALMLWFGAGAPAATRPWVLLVVPLLPLLVTAWALRALHRLEPLPLWPAWQRQLRADGELLQRRTGP